MVSERPYMQAPYSRLYSPVNPASASPPLQPDEHIFTIEELADILLQRFGAALDADDRFEITEAIQLIDTLDTLQIIYVRERQFAREDAANRVQPSAN